MKIQDIYPAATLEGDLNTSTSAAYIEKGYYNINTANVVDKSQAIGITDYQNNNGYTYSITNVSGWESGTRLRKAAAPNGPHRSIIPNKKRGDGIRLGGNLTEIFTWRETVIVPSQQKRTK